MPAMFIAILVATVAALIFIAVSPSRWYGRLVPPASTKQGEEWSPAPELTLPTPRPTRITWQGVLIRVCGAIIVSFLLFLWFFMGYTFYRGIARIPQERVMSLVAVAIFVAFGLLTGVVFKSFFGPSVEMQLLRRGSPARAVITEVRMLPTLSYGRSYRVTFEFRDEVNNATKGSFDWFLIWTPQTGDIVTALYDPDDTKRCTLYPARSYGIARPKTS
jgi:hypothetical protein